MPWQEVSTMSLRQEFVSLAGHEGANVRELCRRFAITPRTGYKWLGRYARAGAAGLVDQSRRPQHSPDQTPRVVEDRIVALRQEHPAWGARKLHAVLEGKVEGLPAPSTLSAILRRRGLVDPTEARKHRAWQRFEHPQPNDLWQADFKGHVPLQRGRCHPLTVLDDHSRYALGLNACADEAGSTVQPHFRRIFQLYGLPVCLLLDNGPPWGGDPTSPYTVLTAWLVRLGIRVCHGRPYHPQTQGKEERFHRTLVAEVLGDRCYLDLPASQSAFDHWRRIYNHERPHQALDDAVPASRYCASTRSFPDPLPPIEYAPDLQVRMVQGKGEISFQRREFVVGEAFRGHPVGLRPTLTDGQWEVYFCHQLITTIDLRLNP